MRVLLRLLPLPVLAVQLYSLVILRVLYYLRVKEPGVVEIVVALRLALVVWTALRVRRPLLKALLALVKELLAPRTVLALTLVLTKALYVAVPLLHLVGKVWKH